MPVDERTAHTSRPSRGRRDWPTSAKFAARCTPCSSWRRSSCCSSCPRVALGHVVRVECLRFLKSSPQGRAVSARAYPARSVATSESGLVDGPASTNEYEVVASLPRSFSALVNVSSKMRRHRVARESHHGDLSRGLAHVGILPLIRNPYPTSPEPCRRQDGDRTCFMSSSVSLSLASSARMAYIRGPRGCAYQARSRPLP